MTMQQATLKQSLSKSTYENNPNVKISDKDDNGLEVFHYITCDNDSDETTKVCRGLVFDNDKLVVKSFPYTDEYVTPRDSEELKKYESIIGDIRFFSAVEGALIRLFYYNDRWYVSTHRKLNAFKTKWGHKDSFGLLFLKALDQEYANNEKLRDRLGTDGENNLERLTKTLDKDCQYMFILKNTGDNCIVCSETENGNLLFVGKFKDNNLDFTDDIGINYPLELKFTSIDEMVEYVQNKKETESPGVMMFLPDNRQVKVVNEYYDQLFDVRGNQASIKFRYLQIRMNSEKSNMLKYLYPNYVDTFENYENIIYDKAKEIYNSYVSRFIKKQYITLPKNEYSIMRVAHTWHLENRSENKISLNKIIDILNQQTPTALNRLIKSTILSQHEPKVAKKLINTKNNTTVQPPPPHSPQPPPPPPPPHSPQPPPPPQSPQPQPSTPAEEEIIRTDV